MDVLTEFWYLWLVLLALIVLLVFATRKAAEAVKTRQETIRTTQAELERYKYMLDKYGDMSAEEAADCDADELAEGITACVQRKVETAADPVAKFNEQPLWKRNVYAVYYFLEDTSSGPLSFFFKNNGQPVSGLAAEFVPTLCPECEDTVRAAFDMYDDNEDVSYDAEKLGVINAEFAKIFDARACLDALKEYITGNL